MLSLPAELTAGSTPDSLRGVKQAVELRLRAAMDSNDGWGRAAGRRAYTQLLGSLDAESSNDPVVLSLGGIVHLDMSFAAETIVAIAKLHGSARGFCISDVSDPDLLENIDAAAKRAGQPLIAITPHGPTILGPSPTAGTSKALQIIIRYKRAKAVDIARDLNTSLANASNKLKLLWSEGFVMRQEESAATGGKEYIYYILD